MPDRREQNFQKWTGCGKRWCEETHFPLRSYHYFWFRSVQGLAGMGLTFFIAAPVVLCFAFLATGVGNTVVFWPLLNLACTATLIHCSLLPSLDG